MDPDELSQPLVEVAPASVRAAAGESTSRVSSLMTVRSSEAPIFAPQTPQNR
jgi:hypothetical protein